MMDAWWRLVKFGFRLLYHEMAFTYDLVSRAVSLGQWRCWQRSALKFLDAPSDEALILELAHGTGDLQLDLHEAGYRSIGLDFSPQMGRIAQAKLMAHDLPARLARGAGQALPFGAERFPAVVCTFPTPFILEAATLDEIWRVLLPDGKLIIVFNGQLEGGGALRAGVEALLRLTGQRGRPDAEQWLMDVFASRGFALELIRVPCQRSEALVARAVKLLGN